MSRSCREELQRNFNGSQLLAAAPRDMKRDMTTPALLQRFPVPKDLLAPEPEELAAVLMEVIPGVEHQAGFVIGTPTGQAYGLVPCFWAFAG